MNNNDILVRLRYALDIKDSEMVEIFKIGGVEATLADIQEMLVKSEKNLNKEDDVYIEIENESARPCDDPTMHAFLNGLILYKRGRQEPKPGEAEKVIPSNENTENINNVLLKKVKIALALNSDDMLSILKEAGVILSKGELSAVFRKEGHKNYKQCGDRYARNFLKGLAMRYRK